MDKKKNRIILRKAPRLTWEQYCKNNDFYPSVQKNYAEAAGKCMTVDFALKKMGFLNDKDDTFYVTRDFVESLFGIIPSRKLEFLIWEEDEMTWRLEE